MTYKAEEVEFTLRDVGSEIIDQLSSDIYTGPNAILRELVKNSYDAYLALETDILSSDDVPPKIHIKRRREGKKGHLIIADEGIGQSIEDLKGHLQIGISSKQALEHATGFRGLGSWAILGGGSNIVIESSRQGLAERVRLEINVRRVYELLSPTTSLDDILNNPSCVRFEREKGFDSSRHFTVIDIICDGPAEKIRSYEINRLYPYTDPKNRDLGSLLITSCPIPFAADSAIYEDLRKVYEEVGYEPMTLTLDGDALERRLPRGLSEFSYRRLTIGDRTVAIAWTVEDRGKTGEIKVINEAQHRLRGPSIQLLKYNVPVGEPGLFADPKLRTLKWYIGEVHVIAEDVRPNASGDDFRAGSAREAFRDRLQGYYRELEKKAEEKSQRLSLVRALKKGEAAATKLAESRVSAKDQARLEKEVADAVERIQQINSRKVPRTVAETRTAAVKKSPDVVTAKAECLKVLKGSVYWEKFAQSKAARREDSIATRERTKPQVRASESALSEPSNRPLTADELQAGLGRAVPRLREEVGLTEAQIESLFEILADIFGY